MTHVYADFQEEISNRWSSTIGISYNENLILGEPIKGPINTWFNFAEIYFLDTNFRIHKDCLYFYTNKEKGRSKFTYSRGQINNDCLASSIKKARIDKIYKMGIQKEESSLKLTVDAKDFVVILRNLPSNQDLKLNSNSRTEPLFSKYNSEFGEVLKEGDTCFNTDDNCREIKPDICNFCPSGVREIKANGCFMNYKKICSSKSCGGRGEFACLRGHTLFSDIKSYCMTDSPIGFCKKPSRVFCEQGVLICR